MGGAIYNLCSELKDKFDKDFDWTKSSHFIEIKVVLFSKDMTGIISPVDNKLTMIANKQYSSGDIQLVKKQKKSLVIEELEKHVGMYVAHVLSRDPLLDKEQTFIGLTLKSGIATFKSELVYINSGRDIFKRIEIEKEKNVLESVSSYDLSGNPKLKRI